jgi:hypothetical protein
MSQRHPSSYIDRIARIRIELDHLQPVIWRTVEVPLTTNVRGLHQVIQAVMLFEDYHLFRFDVTIEGEERHYGIPDPDGSDWIRIVNAQTSSSAR